MPKLDLCRRFQTGSVESSANRRECDGIWSIAVEGKTKQR
jgi:hypothetical protein